MWETESFDRLIRSESDLREKFHLYRAKSLGCRGGRSRMKTIVGLVSWETPRSALPGSSRASCREQQAGSVRSPEAKAALATDEPQIIVGTHALLYESISFSNLGLAVIDEQHKFGVAQRARLTAREPAPDVLVMTATPIPRTLTMTIYGDLDVSTIDEMPKNRGKNHHCGSRYVEVGRGTQLFENGIGEGTPALCDLSVD